MQDNQISSMLIDVKSKIDAMSNNLINTNAKIDQLTAHVTAAEANLAELQSIKAAILDQSQQIKDIGNRIMQLEQRNT